MECLAPLLGHASLAGLLPALVAAQGSAIDPAETVDLGEITFSVLGADPVGVRAAPFTLTGSKTAAPIAEVLPPVSVVGAEEIALINAAKVDEALEGTTGVPAAPIAFDSDTNRIGARGFDATRTGQLLDGLPRTA